MKEFWDERYSQAEFAYGEEPNIFVKERLPDFQPGKVLFPAEGEGRNSVYAAELGWEVAAFDFSSKGKERADKLAASKGVSIDYQVKGILEESYEAESFDVICLTYVHFPPEIKDEMHPRLDRYLKPGGHIILEAFSKEHRELNKVNPDLGGPPDASMMYSKEEIKHAFGNYEIVELSIEMRHLNEGFGHVGEGSVIRFIGRKPN
ncbi:class I SAM-dependent methyltransferase [Carboxylicivirga marina]|uniref:class I SAM-dependent methyltransferase n=1 Tax=Carboxylicivirga marina TaxID=2800988 RepID=UPI00259A3797|nr:class I SAM-dependent methyltransferase [uncultured Carboxylicivirga sp.]